MLETPKGTRDILPEDMIFREEIIQRIIKIFSAYGFQPLQTPALENWDTLAAKGAGGQEILKETYNFEDKGGRRIGLRYDLTVPLARVMASNPNLSLPFKRYQIEKVWRYGDIGRDRFREFLQCDIDTIGSEDVIADAEIIACAISVFSNLGFKKFSVKLNNRKILSALVEYSGIKKEKEFDVLKSIDKFAKTGLSNVKKELLEKGFPKNSVEKILELIQVKSKDSLSKLEKMIGNISSGKEGIEELRQIVSCLEKFGVKSNFEVDLSLARGLEYYTGPIFEVTAEEGIGSIAGGGRYDKMIGMFSKRDIPATGISIGIERVLEVMKDQKMFVSRKSKVKVFVAYMNEAKEYALNLVEKLRNNFIPTDFDLKNRNLSRQLEYADSSGIPYVIVIGPKEMKAKMVRLKDMKNRKENDVSINDLMKILKNSD